MNPVIIAVIIVAALGLVFGLVLAVAAVVFAVKKDEKTELILSALPGANCGGCGYSGCEQYAQAVAEGKAKGNLCTPGGSEAAGRIALVTGTKAEEVIPKEAVVLCQGDCGHSKNKMDYDGIPTCAAANAFFGGPGACRWGCLGFGDCAAKCAFDAIEIIDGVAVINRAKCEGCGTCVLTCPKGIIRLINADEKVAVACSSQDSGKVTRANCTIGCIACGKCVKVCPKEAIKIENNLAVIDYALCDKCGKCAENCPTDAIKTLL